MIIILNEIKNLWHFWIQLCFNYHYNESNSKNDRNVEIIIRKNEIKNDSMIIISNEMKNCKFVWFNCASITITMNQISYNWYILLTMIKMMKFLIKKNNKNESNEL